MSNNDANRKRILADVVTVDVWHSQFDENKGTADLHVDVVFDEGRMGGETDSKVRFRLSLKKAELVLLLPPTEPIKIDKAKVARGTAPAKFTKTIKKEHSHEYGLKGDGKLALDMQNLSATLNTEASADSTNKSFSGTEYQEDLPIIQVTQSKNQDDNYRWIMQPLLDKTLRGKPWDSALDPRVGLVDTRQDRTKGIPPTVLVEVRCRREDLHITQIELKDQNLWMKIQAGINTKNRLVAAEAYIRNRLVEEGLEVTSIDDKFGMLTLARAASGND